MSIELLWLIPIVALALFLPLLILSMQRQSTEHAVSSQTRDLAREVEQFNSGFAGQSLVRKSNQGRLSEIEKTINLVTAALSSQQEIIAAYKGKDTSYEFKLHELKEKLASLQQEYDIVISENYSLRARIKKLQEQKGSLLAFTASKPEQGNPKKQEPTPAAQSAPHKPIRVANMALYDDTRMFKASDLDDTSEINLNELR